MSSANDLTKLVPGFDFFQGLMKSGSAGLPGIGQWIAPTLEPEELQRRIDELRTVQFWLEQNARLIGTTIQALEVQRMTLATLKGMNMPLADLTAALRVPDPAPRAAVKAAGASAGAGASAAPAAAQASSKTSGRAAAAPSKAVGDRAGTGTPAGAGNGKAAGPVDPLQWWGALTQQFTELATKALSDSSAEMARNLAGTAVKQGLETASNSIERAMAVSGKAAAAAAQAGGAVAGVALKQARAVSARRRKA
jgi:hypothetical protein